LYHQPIYFVAETFEKHMYNAGVVRMHQEEILKAAGCKPLVFKYSGKKTVFYKIARIIQCLQLAVSLPKHSKVLFHFPLQASVYNWLLTLLQLRGICTVALIIDIDGLRDNDDKLFEKEVQLLKKFSLLIAHNAAMKDILLQQLPSAKISCINIFDYPVKPVLGTVKISNKVCFAGNLNKATFVNRLNEIPTVRFNVYGPCPDVSLKDSDTIFYKGVVLPDKLPAELEGSFGLVWDGDLLDVCDNYLRYNNPHKLSLYVTAGLPVIVWEHSAIAAFVNLYDIGFTINSIREIPEKVQQMSKERFDTMQQNALAIGKKTAGGYFLKSMINELRKG
jgi:hypothetical protein